MRNLYNQTKEKKHLVQETSDGEVIDGNMAVKRSMDAWRLIDRDIAHVSKSSGCMYKRRFEEVLYSGPFLKVASHS